MKKHQKHTNLVRRDNGIYAPNEVALLGAKCSIIGDLVREIANRLPQYHLAYFDASHAEDVEPNRISNYTLHAQGNATIDTVVPINPYVQRIQFSPYDCVLINGNHYAGNKQVVFLHPEKEASIVKRIDQINDVQFFIQLSQAIEPFAALKEKFPNWQEIPCYAISEIDAIVNHVSQMFAVAIPSVQGLVLTGGKSARMGKDKASLSYVGKPQKEVAFDLLSAQGLTTYYSVANPNNQPRQIHDTFLNLGPFGGICSAFQSNPNTAWFVLATDLPFVNQALIELVLSKRNPAKVATAVKGNSKEFPEPLIAIYEPRAYPILLQFLAQGYSCPRKMLINADIEIVEVDDAWIRNVNTPEEYEAAKKELA